MTKVLRGGFFNRMLENKEYSEEIKVGTRLTEFHYSDRDVYEVIEVQDQKHVVIRQMTAVAIGEPMSNTWELKSDENNPTFRLTKRGAYWYFTNTVTAEQYEERKDDVHFRLACAHLGITETGLKRKGKVTRYQRANVTFGMADYYYDYSF